MSENRAAKKARPAKARSKPSLSKTVKLSRRTSRTGLKSIRQKKRSIGNRAAVTTTNTRVNRQTGTKKNAARRTPIRGRVRAAEIAGTAKTAEAEPTDSIARPSASAQDQADARNHQASEIPPILLEDDQPPRAVASGAGYKFALGHEPTTEAAESSPRLPDTYGTGRVLLLARDPQWLYTHWDLTPSQQRAYNRKSADRHLVVRLHCENPVGKTERETHVHPESRHWFIQTPHPAGTYVAELGYYNRDKVWVSVATSEPATTPPPAVATEKTAEFVRVADLPPDAHAPSLKDWREPRAPEPIATDTGFVSARPLHRAEPKHDSPPPSFEKPIGNQSNAWQTEFSASVSIPPQVSWIPVLEPEAPADAPPQSVHDWSERQERELNAMMDPMRSGFLSSTEMAVPGSNALGISSPGGPTSEQRSFWLSVNADLVIYGASEPGANFTLDGIPIEARPDGTFSCRFALPDGNYAAEIITTSADGEKRSVRLVFRRKTESSDGVSEASSSGAPTPLDREIAG
jgi:hypothetical protein